MTDFAEYGLFGLFAASFLAATILPLSSEAVLAALIALGYNPWVCLEVATLGNWLGGISSYFLGFLGKWEWMERWFRVKKESVEKWKNKLDKYGSYFALLCWAPLIGDLIAIALGFARINFWKVAFFMLIGKAARYAVIAWVLSALI
ncbi:MAG: hypothetical protein COA57_01585 [Flavobacteriales bacterium]|nr:MAG: hypothetical protein COA57_01585 [Flavobacteriales bacterium]